MAIVYADDQDFNPVEASLDVDALVNDGDIEVAISRSNIGFNALDYPRRATPTIPPGFSAPATPRSFSEHSTRPVSRNAFGATPAIPVIPATPIRTASPVKLNKDKKADVATESSSIEVAKIPKGAATVLEAQDESVKTGNPAKVQSVDDTPKKPAAVVSHSAPKESKPPSAGDTSKAVAKEIPKATPARKGPATGTIDTSPPKASKEIATPTASSSKRQHPGKLDIAAATKLSEGETPVVLGSVKNDNQAKNPRTISLASSSSVPPSPAATSTGSPIKRSGPRTIRVVPTPKTEVPPPLSAASATSVAQLPSVDKLRSRQASIASLHQPGTPSSELISDNASITSTSVSRANSPPPIGGKVGTAPIRKKTKAQAKKDRQERARQIAEEQAMAMEELVKSSEPEPVQAPIMGRKKKSKKPAVNNPKLATTVTKSQDDAASPEVGSQEDGGTVESTSAEASSSKTSQPEKQPPLVQVSQAQGPKEPSSASAVETPKEKLPPTPQAIIADLQSTGELAADLEFLKPPSSTLAHSARGPASAAQAGSQDGKADTRTLITPYGRFFLGLSQELEERALSLEKSIEERKGPTRFRPRKNLIPQSHTSPKKAKSKGKAQRTVTEDGEFADIANYLLEQNEKYNAAVSGSSSHGLSAQQLAAKLDPTSTLLSSTSIPLPPVPTTSAIDSRLPPLDIPKPTDSATSPAPKLPPIPAPPAPADATAYLNHFVLPRTDNPPPNSPRSETAAVGGAPPVQPSVTVSQFSKAAKAVAEGGTGGHDLESLGIIAANMFGGVVANSLEALVGAGCFQNAVKTGNGAAHLQGLDFATIMGQAHAAAGGNGSAKRNVLGVDEAEQARLAAKKETEVLEKKLIALIKKNRRLLARQ